MDEENQGSGSFQFATVESVPVRFRTSQTYNIPTPQMLAQIHKNRLESVSNESGNFLGSGLKQLFSGSLFGTKSTNTSFEASAPVDRRSINTSPVFGYGSRTSAAIQTTKDNIVDKSYVDFLNQTHREELKERDDIIADRDRTIAELERENRTLLSENRRLRELESREKKWNKYF